MKPTRRDYCQFLLSTHVNYTQTYFADHHQHFSHDAINRYLQDDQVTPEIIWEQVKTAIESGRLHEAEPRIRDTDGSLKNSF